MNAKPIDILTAEGRTHLTKAQIEARRQAEQELLIGPGKLRAPDYVKNDPVAKAKWRECMKLYRDCPFITAMDTGHLARYCRTYSEYKDLLKHREQVATIDFTLDEQGTVSEEFEARRGSAWAQRTWGKIEYLLSVSGLIAIDAAINKKMEQLIKMEDRLFLNPLAKVKNIPKRVKEPGQTPLEKAGFGNV